MSTTPSLTVGMGATIHGYSDSYACTVIEFSANGKRVKVQEDEATLLNGFNSGEPDALQFEQGGFCGHTSGTQRWECKPNPKGAIRTFSLRKNGRWVESGGTATGGTRLTLGVRHHHYDFNF